MLLQNVKITRVLAQERNEQAVVRSDLVDMVGFRSITLIALLSSVLDIDALIVSAECGNDPSGSDAKSIATLRPDPNADWIDHMNQVMALEIASPPGRYVRCAIARDPDFVEVDGILALLTRPRQTPVKHDPATVLGAASIIGQQTERKISP